MVTQRFTTFSADLAVVCAVQTGSSGLGIRPDVVQDVIEKNGLIEVFQFSSIFVTPSPALGHAGEHRAPDEFFRGISRLERRPESHRRPSGLNPNQNLATKPAAYINSSFPSDHIAPV